MPLSELDHEDKQDLRRLVLSFFKEAKMSRNMHLDDYFQGAGYENLEIRQMMYALEKSGLIYKIRATVREAFTPSQQMGKPSWKLVGYFHEVLIFPTLV